jgi:hypothetical protein
VARRRSILEQSLSGAWKPVKARIHRGKLQLKVPVSKNIKAGFYDQEGIFHPIRASSDYDQARAGEGPRKKRAGRGRKRRRGRR